jgi:mitosis inhibitor protein kinase SWE1
MDWAYSPHREAGGTLHLPSPTHAHSYHVDAIQKLRRSLSRSPSKSSHFHLKTSHSPNGTPSSPLSPHGIQRAASPAYGRENYSNPAPPSPLASHTPATTKGNKKFALRRVAPFRSSPRINNPSRSPVRRALSDSSSQGNSTPSTSRRPSAEEDTENAHGVFQAESEVKPPLRFELNDGPIKFEFSRTKQENAAPGDRNYPAKSSPLKRIDGRVNLDQSNFGSPAKRRSLHSATLGSDADVFSLFSQENLSSSKLDMAASYGADKEMTNSPFASSNVKRTSSLRKSTLQNRHAPRTRLSAESHIESTSPAASPAQKARNRMSLDSSILFGPSMQSPFLRPSSKETAQPVFQHRQTPHRQAGHLPHPLSNALTASSSGSNLTETTHDTSPKPRLPPAAPKAMRYPPHFTKSLPIGSSRPFGFQDMEEDSQGSFATPISSYKNAKPNPIAFMSTGLISKKNRNIEAHGDFTTYEMPGTPSKRNSFPPISGTPLDSAMKKPTRPSLQFGTPSTPFGSPGIFGGRSSNLFAVPFANHALVRRSSFLSIDGDDISQSPVGNPDSQSSADELPPTPTKPASKNGKESSLRSSLFGRRTSLGPDTFVPPGASDSPPKDARHSKFHFTTTEKGEKELSVQDKIPTPAELIVSWRQTVSPSASPTPALARSASSYHVTATPECHMLLRSHSLNPVDHSCSYSASPIDVPEASGRASPHTPHESFTPPDPSGLSISAGKRDLGSLSFNSSTSSAPSFPPATPTASRDQQFLFGISTTVPVVAVTTNDVEISLTSRFETVTQMGSGEFSQVYRVSNFINGTPGRFSPAVHAMGSVYAVKKSKRPFIGQKDRQRQMKEAEILRALRTNDHIVHFVDSWEDMGHLYIQTEFCENGNLFDFLKRTGDKARLDDFRIWKILLELTLVSLLSMFLWIRR